MLAFCRAEYGAVHLLARQLVGCREALLVASIEDYSQLAPGVGRAHRSSVLAEPETAAGQAGRGRAAARSSRYQAKTAQLCRARPGARRWRLAPRRRGSSSGSCARLPEHREARSRSGTRTARSRARIARGELDEAAASLEELREIEHLVGTAPLLALRRAARRACSPPRGASMTSARPLLEDAVDRFERERCAVRGRSDEDRARHEPRGVGPHRCSSSAKRRRAVRSCSSTRRGGARPSGRGASSPRPLASTDFRASRASHPASVTCSRLLAEGLTNRQIAVRLVISEHTDPPPCHEHPPQARPSVADGRGRPCRTFATCSMLQADSQSWLSSPTRSKMAATGEVEAG